MSKLFSVRLSPAERTRLESHRHQYGLRSEAEAVRDLINKWAPRVEPTVQPKQPVEENIDA